MEHLQLQLSKIAYSFGGGIGKVRVKIISRQNIPSIMYPVIEKSK